MTQITEDKWDKFLEEHHRVVEENKKLKQIIEDLGYRVDEQLQGLEDNG